MSDHTFALVAALACCTAQIWTCSAYTPAVEETVDLPTSSYNHANSSDRQSCWLCSDCKLGVDKQADAAWAQLAHTVATWDMLDAEKAHVTRNQQQAEQAARHTSSECKLGESNVPVVFELRGAQMEAFNSQLLVGLGDAALLNSAAVRRLNAVIVDEARKLLKYQRECDQVRDAAHRTQWTIQRDALAAQHKHEHIQELQLLHLGREVSQLLEPHAGARAKSAEKQLELMLTHSRLMHVRSETIGFDVIQRDTLSHALPHASDRPVVRHQTTCKTLLAKCDSAGSTSAHQVEGFCNGH